MNYDWRHFQKLKFFFIKNMPKFIFSILGINQGIEKFKFDKVSKVKEDIQTKYGFKGDLLEIFTTNKGNIIHKWHHYIPLYDRYFSNFRGKEVKFLEIGVSKGGSLEMWRKYFGKDAIIYGIDIDPNCAKYDGIAGKVRIGSQDDPMFLESVINEMGGVDVILDDGSHQMKHILKTFKIAFPLLNNGGIYMIEDLHTSYWVNFGGGYYSKSNFFRFLINIVNDMHHWYHWAGVKYPEISKFCSGIHIHDSITVFEKSEVPEPTHSHIPLTPGNN